MLGYGTRPGTSPAPLFQGWFGEDDPLPIEVVDYAVVILILRG